LSNYFTQTDISVTEEHEVCSKAANQDYLFLLNSIITSKTRVKLLLRLFLNPSTVGYLRGLADEFGESTNSVRTELNRLEEAGMLNSSTEGKRKLYKANTSHPLFPEIQSILKKVTGIEDIIQKVISRLGGVQEVYLTGELAEGKDVPVIDLVIIGSDIDRNYLQSLSHKTEEWVARSVRTLVFTRTEFEEWRLSWGQKLLKIWE
jgi:predicted nucleotidyltransferase